MSDEEHPTSDDLDDDLYDAMYQDGLSAQQRFQEASKTAEDAIEELGRREEQLLAMSQAIHLALRCDKCDVGGGHETMLEKHAEVYESFVEAQKEEVRNEA